MNREILSEEKGVRLTGDIVLRPVAPWTPSVHALLRHLDTEGFPAPRVLGDGVSFDGQETLTFIEGEFVHPRPWSDEGLIKIGQMLRQLHTATASFAPAPDAVWQPWFLRELGGAQRVIGHGDMAPWNTVTRNGLPIALIDWEYAGPVDPLAEVARAAWLFVQLHDDDVAERVGLPSLEVRARQLRLFVDVYGLTARQRGTFMDMVLEVAVYETAEQAIEVNLGPDSVGLQWGIAWRARAAKWMMKNRITLENALA
jgi:hypothetical protein